jgi:putative transposase
VAKLESSSSKWSKIPGAGQYYNWRKKYGGLMPSEMKRLKQLEEENGKLKQLVADLSLDKAMLQDVLKRKL